jgi:hypothetical protein
MYVGWDRKGRQNEKMEETDIRILSRSMAWQVKKTDCRFSITLITS